MIELMVGVAIALFLTTAAVAFARHEVRLLGLSTERLDMLQQGRISTSLLQRDLEVAGAGVGYRDDGSFAGLLMGTFQAGGADFNTAGSGTDITLYAATVAGAPAGARYAARTTDLGIVSANGAFSTIAEHAGAEGELCEAPGVRVRDGELVILRSEDGMSARAALISVGARTGCSWGRCEHGCRLFTAADPIASLDWTSGDGARAVGYSGGEIHGGFERVVWFVDAADPDAPVLRRAVFDDRTPDCARREGCGGIVADHIELIRAVLWEHRASGGAAAWALVPAGTPVSDAASRLRVDVEIVARERVPGDRPHAPVTLGLDPGACLPGPCGAAPDHLERRVFRTSVELKNSGRMRPYGGR